MDEKYNNLALSIVALFIKKEKNKSNKKEDKNEQQKRK